MTNSCHTIFCVQAYIRSRCRLHAIFALARYGHSRGTTCANISPTALLCFALCSETRNTFEFYFIKTVGLESILRPRIP